MSSGAICEYRRFEVRNVSCTAGDRRLVAAARHHQLTLLPDHDRGTGVLARRQHATRGDGRVLQQLERDEPVVRRRFEIVEDRAELREVTRPQEVRDVAHRFGREQAEHGGVDLQQLAPTRLDGRDAIGCEKPIWGVGVVARREHVLVDEVVAHRSERYRRRVRV
jgi:hypothetical protein